MSTVTERSIGSKNGCFLIKDTSLLQGWNSPVYNYLWSKGFIRWRTKGVFKGVDWVFVNICSKMFAPGIPGYQVTAVACDHAVTFEEFKTIYEIFGKYVGLDTLNMTIEEQDAYDKKWTEIKKSEMEYLHNLTYEKFFGEVKNELKELLRYDIKTEEELICYMKKEENTIKEAYRMNKELYSPEGIKKGNGSKRSASSVAYCLYLMFC